MKEKSLFKSIVGFSVLVLLIAVIISVISSAVLYNETVTSSSGTAAKRCAELVQVLFTFENEDIEDYNEESDAYCDLLENTQYICKILGAKYIYLYTPDVENHRATYLFVVASDPEDSATAARERPFGTVVERDIRQKEIDVLNGEEDTEIEFTNNRFGSVYSWYFPLHDKEGNVVALIGVDFKAKDLNEKIVMNVTRATIPLFLVLTVVFLILFFETRDKIFNPIRTLSLKMKNYDPDKELELDSISAYGEIKEITESFDKMSDAIKKYIVETKLLAFERSQTSAELDIARRIQSGMVPERLIIDENSYRISAFSKAAKEVGGDFYSYFKSDKYIYIVLGDVSGKGVAAAMFMSMTLNIIREKLRSGARPASALNQTNKILCDENPEGMFVTVFAGRYDPATGVLMYANAGHTKPIMLSSDKRYLEPETGIALGLFEDSDIIDETLTLNPGEGILIYSDGATDAVNGTNEFFGEERLLESADCSQDADAVMIIRETISEFIEKQEQFDDLTLLELFRNGERTDDGTFYEKELPPEEDAFDEIKDVLIERLGMSRETRQIILACEEAFVNIASYSGTDKIMVCCKCDKDELIIVFEDNGIPFDPLKKEAPEKDFEDFDKGGMGIDLIEKLASDISYIRKDDKNILTLIFRDKESEN
ncbi:MAG: SpoIIE family protein phosphatase [Saccharofermentans sp.]|nr:SpoIIE family protein phosphatase [Saccharofermentans sp.]